ncbi:hypothetical protein BGZ99_008290 [Dissophora globulifera]|uniref:Transposase n=1 Tax=Dissophora globulifera TaxID=979702 RepID=A0A9P6R7N2_9FUNG|nr:hypothetical protein BGZ99_008290 [Dissophora globulifera]
MDHDDHTDPIAVDYDSNFIPNYEPTNVTEYDLALGLLAQEALGDEDQQPTQPSKQQRQPQQPRKQQPQQPQSTGPSAGLVDNVKRDAGELRRNEYCILIHVYRQLQTLSPEVRATFGSGLRDQLANLTGVGFTTAQKAMRFSKIGHIPIGPSKVGRKQKVLEEDYAEKIKHIVKRKNRDGEMVSAIQINDILKNEYGVEVSLTMLRRDMLRLGMRWEQGPTTQQSTWRARGGWVKRKKSGTQAMVAIQGGDIQQTTELTQGNELGQGCGRVQDQHLAQGADVEYTDGFD